MHAADAVAAYGELIRSGLSAGDIAGRFGVSPTYVKRVLKLSALHPQILKAFAKDEIGMGAAQAYTLTDDTEKQLEVFTDAGDNVHHIRSLLTDEKIDTRSKLFNFISLDEYKQAGGIITSDLFADEGEGYADNPEILFKLVEEGLAKAELEYQSDGWSQVACCNHRPDNFYSLNVIEPQGQKEPTKEQARQLEANRKAQKKIIGDEEQDSFYNEELRGLEREEQTIEASLSFYTDAQKSHAKLIFFLGANGQLETHAVREAVANGPALAFDILLQTLLQQLVHQGGSYSLPLSIRPDAKAVEVDESLMAKSELRSVHEISAADIKALSDENDLSSIRTMDGEVKQRPFAYLVASQIDAGGCYSDEGVG